MQAQSLCHWMLSRRDQGKGKYGMELKWKIPVQWALEGKSLASLLLTLGTSLAQEGDVWSLDQHPFCQAQGTHATV